MVKCSDYSYEKVDQLREKVAEIRRKRSVYYKWPMLESETSEKWRERVAPMMDADTTRKEGESVDEHMKRLFELKSETHEMAPEVLNAISEIFSCKAPSEEDLKKSNWLETKAFIYDVLNLGDIPCDDFSGKKLAG